MELDEQITLTDAAGSKVTLPFINLLRITMIKFQEYFLEYQQETKQSDIVGFNNWIKDKLGTRGKNVML